MLSSFPSKDLFQQEMESFLASDQYFWLGSFGSPAFSIFCFVVFFFFFLTENRLFFSIAEKKSLFQTVLLPLF